MVTGSSRVPEGGAYLQLVGHEDDGLVAKLLLDGVVEDVVGHVGVQGAQRVVQDVHVPVAVQGSGQADSLPLAAAQGGAALSHLTNTNAS